MMSVQPYVGILQILNKIAFLNTVVFQY